jgi:hypothetical protein
MVIVILRIGICSPVEYVYMYCIYMYIVHSCFSRCPENKEKGRTTAVSNLFTEKIIIIILVGYQINGEFLCQGVLHGKTQHFSIEVKLYVHCSTRAQSRGYGGIYLKHPALLALGRYCIKATSV